MLLLYVTPYPKYGLSISWYILVSWYFLVYLDIWCIFLFKIDDLLLYNIVLVLSYINMNLPRVYTCSPSWIPLSPPSPYHPSGSSQCTSPKHPVSCIEPGLAIHFIYDIIHVSMPFSQVIPPSSSPTESKRLFSFAVSHTGLSLPSFWIPYICVSILYWWRRQWHPTPVLLPGESQGWGSLVGCHLWDRTESDTTEAT